MSIAENIRNKMQFRKDTNLFLVEPLVGATPSWRKMEDVPNMNKAIILDFTEIKGKELYAKFVRKEDKSYWRLYIVDSNNTSLVYVNTTALNPLRRHIP